MIREKRPDRPTSRTLVLSMAVADAAGWYGGRHWPSRSRRFCRRPLAETTSRCRTAFVSVLAERDLPAEALTIEITEGRLAGQRHSRA